MNKKGLALDKESIVILIIVLVAMAVIVAAYTQIYQRTRTSQEGMETCSALGGECIKSGECKGEEYKNAKDCNNDKICCVTIQSITGEK